jgi:hypothetical protein
MTFLGYSMDTGSLAGLARLLRPLGGSDMGSPCAAGLCSAAADVGQSVGQKAKRAARARQCLSSGGRESSPCQATCRMSAGRRDNEAAPMPPTMPPIFSLAPPYRRSNGPNGLQAGQRDPTLARRMPLAQPQGKSRLRSKRLPSDKSEIQGGRKPGPTFLVARGAQLCSGPDLQADCSALSLHGAGLDATHRIWVWNFFDNLSQDAPLSLGDGRQEFSWKRVFCECDVASIHPLGRCLVELSAGFSCERTLRAKDPEALLWATNFRGRAPDVG